MPGGPRGSRVPPRVAADAATATPAGTLTGVAQDHARA